MSNRIPTALLGALILSASLEAAEPASADPGGWTKAAWGMTLDQVRAVLPAAELLTGPEDARTFVDPARHLNLTAPLDVKDIHLPGGSWSAFFLFQQGKLSEVILKPDSAEGCELTTYSQVRDLLVEKYGRPLERADAQDRITDRTALWTFLTTTIELSYTDAHVELPGDGPVIRLPLDTLRLVYRRRVVDANL